MRGNKIFAESNGEGPEGLNIAYEEGDEWDDGERVAQGGDASTPLVLGRHIGRTHQHDGQRHRV